MPGGCHQKFLVDNGLPTGGTKEEMIARGLDFAITPEHVQKQMKSINLSGKRLGVASAIVSRAAARTTDC